MRSTFSNMVVLSVRLLGYVKKPTYLPNPLAAAGLVRGPAAVRDIIPRTILNSKLDQTIFRSILSPTLCLPLSFSLTLILLLLLILFLFFYFIASHFSLFSVFLFFFAVFFPLISPLILSPHLPYDHYCCIQTPGYRVRDHQLQGGR